ncbi:MAG: hypothetical protein GY865_19820 [candidate division Zixibacteria bacterium]|nr:hypothetical protein [candidate division Zixibacteria bacterium]
MTKQPEEVFDCVCCFCGCPIVADAVEPMAINIFDKGAGNGQSLFSHVDCLKKCLHQSIPFLDHRERLECLQNDN